ncbi:MAG: hypothetical protein ACYSUI_04060 [Planctomycetota bacterium]|jgi:hypothetical protein
MRSISEDHPLRRLFRGLVEHAFCTQVGMCAPALTDYLTELLVNFAHVDALYALRRAGGKRLDQIADMVALLNCGTDGVRGEDELLVHRHVGDFTLFWSGVYPEHLHHSRGIAFKDRLIDYVQQGKRSYAIASRLTDENTSPPASLFGRLSSEFEFCCHGLALVRRGWERADPEACSQVRTLLY